MFGVIVCIVQLVLFAGTLMHEHRWQACYLRPINFNIGRLKQMVSDQNFNDWDMVKSRCAFYSKIADRLQKEQRWLFLPWKWPAFFMSCWREKPVTFDEMDRKLYGVEE